MPAGWLVWYTVAVQVWQVAQFGEPEQMMLADVPTPEPLEGEVRVSLRAAAVNFFDLLLVQGKYQARPPFPFTPGAEAAGIVSGAGPGVSEFKPGDPVIALPSFGCFAEEVICPASRLLRIPAGMDFDTAAAMPIVYQTSWFALVDRACIRPGEWLLVHAGASGVGMSAIQIGKALGAQVIATASTEAKLVFCRDQGADHVLNYTDPGWVDLVRSITGGGADVVFDPVGGDIFDLSTRCVAAGGRILVIGFTSGRIPTVQVNRLLLKNISVVGAVWGGWCQTHPEYLHQTHQRLVEMFEAGKIKPVVSRRYPLDAVPKAMRDLADRAAAGKSIVVI
jgi:NADPH2:quinone reductase